MKLTQSQYARIRRKADGGKSELAIESECLAWLNSLPGVFAWKNHTSGFFDPKRKIFRKHHSPWAIRGTSDILGIFRGRFFAVEVKSGSNKLTEDQVRFLKQVQERDGLGIAVWSRDQLVQEFQKWISTIAEEPLAKTNATPLPPIDPGNPQASAE